MKQATLIVCLVLCTVLVNCSNYTFEEYVQKYRKRYSVPEYKRREQVYYANLNSILMHNNQAMNAIGGWTAGINQFTDMTVEEFKATSFGYSKRLANLQRAQSGVVRSLLGSVVKNISDLPKEVDWRTKGVVTPVKLQGGCGSCWAFATAETVESHLAISTGYLSELSEQQLISCVQNPHHCGGQGGCQGATYNLGFEWVQQNGLYTEWEYPYESFIGEIPACDNGTIYPLAAITGYAQVPSNSYEELMIAVATQGPVAIAVDASAWMSYQKGVFDGCNQQSPELNHGVQLVGYGEDETTGELYWLVRVSLHHIG
jgi:cathepsin L